MPSTVNYGDVLVVSEGPDRLSWRRGGPVGWTPEALWPDERQAAEIRWRLVHGAPVLVVIGATEAGVPLLDEQLAAAPAEIAELAREVAGDLATLRIPALDWLPADLRRRGLRFVRESAERAARTPAALRPALVLDEPDPDVPHLRFVHRVGPCPYLARDLSDIAAHAFPALEGSVAA